VTIADILFKPFGLFSPQNFSINWLSNVFFNNRSLQKRVVCTKFDIYVLFVNGVPKVSNVAATQAKLKNETISVKSDGFSSDQIVLRMSFGIINMILYLHL
jgi:hypothetical protein